MLAQGPLMSIQGPTLWVAAAAAAGAQLLGTLYPWLSLSISIQHVDSLQCQLVSLSGLSEGLIMQAFPPPGPRLGLQLADLQGGSHSSPLLVLLQHGSTPLPVQAAPQGGQDVLDSLLPLPGPAGWWAG